MKLLKNRGIIVGILMIVAILFFHTYQWAEFYSTRPWDKWSREQSIGTTFYNRPPLITSDKNNHSIILYDLEKDMDAVVLADDGEVDYTKQIKPPYEKIDRVKKKMILGNQLIWQEGDALYQASFTKESLEFGSRKVVEEKGIIDFEILQEEKLLLVATEHNLKILTQENPEEIFNLKVKDKMKKIALSSDEKGNVYIAYSLQKDEVTDDIYVLQLQVKDNPIKTVQNTKVHTVEYLYKYTMGDLKITSLSEDLYLWYTENKWDSRGAESYGEYIYFPEINSLTEKKVQKIELPIMWGKASQYTTKINPVGHDSTVDLYLASEWADTRRENGNDVFVVHFNKGEMIEYQRITSTDYTSNHPKILSDDTNTLLVWTDIRASREYEVKIASTNPQAIEKFSGITQEDWIKGLGISLMALAYGLLYLLTRAIYQIPSLMLVGAAEFFNIGKLREKKYLLLGLGGLVYNIIKIFTFDFYYRPLALEIMPSSLQFSGSMLIIPIVTSIISLLPIYLFDRDERNKGQKISAIGLYLFYILFDTLLTNLIYTPYLVA